MKNRKRLSASAKLAYQFYTRVQNNSLSLDAESLRSKILSCQPDGCTGAESFKWSYLADEILSKYCGPTTEPSSVRRDRAIDKLLAADKTCAETSMRLAKASEHPWFYARAATIIADIIGDPTDYLTEFVDELSTFTGGAAVGYPRRSSDVYYKYASERNPTVTEHARKYGELLIAHTPLWECELSIVPGNVLFTVPKKADIDRAAAKEPSINQALQKGVGSYIRSRLRRAGIDLNDQSINQDLAREGSLLGNLATIDLSAASDSISPQLVLDLVGFRWYALLDDLRSREVKLPDGSAHRWNLFSTMGNGFTFELESLLFFAIAKAASEEVLCTSSRSPRVSVYGDDIIIETRCFDNVSFALQYSGFTLNPKKTFSEGPFRESCGAHYWKGVSVKPFYIRKPVDTPQRVIWLLNALRRWSSGNDGWCDPSIYNLWLQLRRQCVPPEFLGGRDIDSISEVFSPEAPRKSFKRRILPREIDDVPAVLRWFNYAKGRHLRDDIYATSYLRSLGYSDTYDPHASDCSMDQICCIGDREVTMISDFIPSCVDIQFYMFPQETVTSQGF